MRNSTANTVANGEGSLAVTKNAVTGERGSCDPDPARTLAHTAGSTLLDLLPCDVLKEILRYPDFPAAVALAHFLVQLTSSSSSSTAADAPPLAATPPCETGSPAAAAVAAAAAATFETVWRELFRRHGFAPESGPQEAPQRRDVLQELDYRRRLRASKWSYGGVGSSSLSLPSRCYAWIPRRRALDRPPTLIPDPDDFCDYGCLLLSPTRSECVLFDPFTGQLEHHPSGWDDGGDRIRRLVSTDFVHHHPCQRNSTDIDAKVLLEDYRGVNFAEYLAEPPPGWFGGAAHIQFEGSVIQVGMEVKPLKDGGLAVVHARTIVVATTRGPGPEAFEDVTEVHAWERPFGRTNFRHPRRCRFRHGWTSIEVDPEQRLLYVATVASASTHSAAAAVASSAPSMATRVVAYPLLPVSADEITIDDAGAPSSPSSWEPEPLFSFDCGLGVEASYLASWKASSNDSTEDSLLVCTSDGSIHWYRHRRLEYGAPVQACLAAAALRCDGGRAPRPVLEAAARASIQNVLVAPSHAKQSFRRPDFLTLHHDEHSGSTILLWTERQLSGTTGTGHHGSASSSSSIEPAAPPFGVEEVIHLPLSPRRVPQLHYDGRQLVVYGQDHIGCLVLVYVKATPDDDGLANSSPAPHGDGSGGVLQWSGVWRLSRRIRHDALGGHDRLDSLHLACNERYLVLNTKLGHHLAESGSGNGVEGGEGLLVIDFEEAAAFAGA